jgi:hypothetical protein
MNKNWRENNLHYYYQSIKGPIYMNDDLLVSSIEENKNKSSLQKTITEIVDNTDLFSKRMFYLRYDRYTLKKIRSIKIVSQLCCCSQEYLRIKMNNIYTEIYLKSKNYINKCH